MFAVYLGALLLICLSPGPNVFLCISTGLQRGTAAVLQTVSGVVLASMLFLALSALGIVKLLSRSAGVFSAVRTLGALYLLYLGGSMLWASRRTEIQSRVIGTHPLLQGFATHVSNPKAILFWTALLPQFIVPQEPLLPQTMLLGITGIAVDAVVLSGYGIAAARFRQRMLDRDALRWLQRVAGAFFVLAGALLLANL